MKSGEITLKQAIDKMLDSYKLRSKHEETRLASHWAELVGPVVERDTRNLTIRGRTLYVKVESSVIRTELGYIRELLRDKVNEFLGSTRILEVKIV